MTPNVKVDHHPVNLVHFRTRHAAGVNGESAATSCYDPRRRSARTNADHLPLPASRYSVTERSQHEL